MTAAINGLDGLQSYLASAVQNIEPKVARGALRAGAEVIAARAREECRSSEVRDTIGVISRTEKGLVSAKVRTIGPGAFIAPWLEYGTDPHFISVDDAQRGGMTIRRINREVKRGSLVINGAFVGTTVHHPGARPYPFMRPAADGAASSAVEAIGGFIASKLTREALEAPLPPLEDGE